LKESLKLLAITLISAATVIAGVHVYKLLNEPDMQILTGDYSEYGVTTQTPVIVYAREGCIYCKMLKEFFTENHIKYVEKDIADPKNKKQLTSLKKSVTPVVLIGDKLITGFDKQAITRELVALKLLELPSEEKSVAVSKG
jgi:glutaredoxin